MNRVPEAVGAVYEVVHEVRANAALFAVPWLIHSPRELSSKDTYEKPCRTFQRAVCQNAIIRERLFGVEWRALVLEELVARLDEISRLKLSFDTGDEFRGVDLETECPSR